MFSTGQTFNRKFSQNDSLTSDGKNLITWNIKFYFVSDSLIMQESFNYIDSLVTFLKTNPGVVVEIGTHSITRGTSTFCCELTQKRAMKISQLLSEKGIDKSRLSPKGYGKTKPLYIDNSTVKCSHCKDDKLQKNLRVEFQILKKKK